MHFHQFGITLVLHATVRNSFKQMRDVRLTDSAKELIKNGNMTRFREQFGDMFVRGVHTGGELNIILQIICKDQNDQSSVKSQLEAGGILGAVSAETNDTFSTTVSKATAEREVRFQHIQIGGNPTASIDATEIVKHALSFASEVRAGASEAFNALLVPYSTLDLPAAPNFVDIQAAKDNLALLMNKRSDALSRLTAFNFVVGHPEQFVIPPEANINGIIGRLEVAVSTLTAAASRCVNKPAEANDALRSVASLDIPLDPLPPRVLGEMVRVPNWVGVNTNDFRDPPPAHPELVRPEVVGLRLAFIQSPTNDPRSDGIIQSTNPPPDTKVPPGTVVNCIVSVFDG